MSAGAPAIPAPGPFPGSHAPPIGQLRVARRPKVAGVRVGLLAAH